MSNGTLEQFRQQWGIDLILPRELHQHIKGQVLLWQEDWLQQLKQALTRLQEALIAAGGNGLINAAGVRYLFVAEDLRRELGGRLHDGVAYEFEDKSRPECIALSDPKWIGLHVSLLTDRRDEIEPDLQVLLPDARLLEEIAHIWDYQLAAAGSPYSSAGVEWLAKFDNREGRKPFDIRNRRIYDSAEDQNAEDWAAAVVWYVFQRERLRERAPEHCEFVERLFQRCLSP